MPAKKKDDLPSDIKRIGIRLRNIRKNRGYSNSDEFAYAYGLNRSQYGKYEAGSEDMRISSLVKTLEKIKVPLNEFFNEEYDSIGI
ncbi:helix-turn-helix domain-containing protein [Pararcticibacter amylolyticus]|uniref:Transcriptional regulator n=1 Tax=Pararcticibacter amylolyticus TaxID=2173175 RepID=A0A2U2P9X7_9SPHI|nr:helix-turn-helix transcriptional regulator [Pararcticibacter amylolyticus]PWG78104.1 transcriptional regulator [Pararcticibacter amylolyticus]